MVIVKIAQYNIFCRPWFLNQYGQNDRIKMISGIIHDIHFLNVDIFVFCEVFDLKHKKYLINEFKKEGYNYNCCYEHCLKPLDPFGTEKNKKSSQIYNK